MKVRYDKKADAAFIRFSGKRPAGGVEVKEGVILHVTDNDQIVALEILDARSPAPAQKSLQARGVKSCRVKAK